jgi:hypothetical protein
MSSCIVRDVVKELARVVGTLRGPASDKKAFKKRMFMGIVDLWMENGYRMPELVSCSNPWG